MQNLSYIEISQKNLLHNFQQFRNFIHPKVKIISVLKANAYGHGLAQIAEILEDHTDYFAVDDIQELEILRNYVKNPILVLGYIPKSRLEEAVLLNADIGVYDLDHVKRIDEYSQNHRKKTKVHVKIDAGLGRQGILPEEAKEFVKALKQFKNIQVEAIYAHFANIEDIGDPSEGALEFSHAQKQISLHQDAIKVFTKNGFPTIRSHISSTAGTFVYEKNLKNHNYVRIGIGLYGMWPSQNIQRVLHKQGIELKPAIRWISHIAQIKTLPANSTIGYGLTHITYQPTQIAIIPQGYSDGYDRGLSNRGEVLIAGERCKVLGRVMMNMFVVDTTHLANIHPEDEVVLLGKQGRGEITAEEIAGKIDTINYEITTRINPLLERQIV